MRLARWTSLAAVMAASLTICGSAALAGPIGVVDDFNSPGLGEYTLTRVLDNGVAESNVSFSDTSGALVASYGGTINQPEQVLFLRNDATLGVGEKLVVDVAQAVSTSQMDFGIAVSATATPTGVSNPTPTDTRGLTNWLAVYVRPSQDSVRVTSSISGTVVTATGVLGSVETAVSKLFIERLSTTSFAVGYINTSAVSFTNTTVNFTATDVGSAIGFYGDLRAAGGVLGGLDNLRIIPEPTAGLLALIGIGGLVSLRKRSADSRKLHSI
jgi:hypothetical protein